MEWMQTACRSAALVVAALVLPATVSAGEPGSGIYAADCAKPDQRVAIEIAANGKATVTKDGERYTDPHVSYRLPRSPQPADFHVALLFEGGRSPFPTSDGRRIRIEIWKGEAAFYALLDGDKNRRLHFCAELRQTARIGPDFDCTKAKGTVEKLICTDDELARRDWALAAAYRKALGRLQGNTDAAQYLKAEQRGWIKGRNDCWKASDIRACVSDEYRDRHATLLARYGMIEAGRTQVWACGEPPQTLYVTPFMTEPPAVNLVRESETATALRHGPDESYEAPFGVWFRATGDSAILEWPQGTQMSCRHTRPLGK
jgi:uncharacterized protein